MRGLLIVLALATACQMPERPSNTPRPGGVPSTDDTEQRGVPPSTPGAAPGARPGATTPGTTTPGTAQTETSTEQAAYDTQFIDAMIAYADYSSELADIGARRAKNPELKVFAQNMAKEHDTRVSQLRNWRELWYPGAKRASTDIDTAARLPGVQPYSFGLAWKTATTEIDPKHPEDVKSVSVAQGAETWNSRQLVQALKDVPDPAFDAFYTASLVAHNRWALDAIKTSEGRLEHPELKNIANQIASEAQGNMDQLATWRQEWFGAKTEKPPAPAAPGTK